MMASVQGTVRTALPEAPATLPMPLTAATPAPETMTASLSAPVPQAIDCDCSSFWARILIWATRNNRAG